MRTIKFRGKSTDSYGNGINKYDWIIGNLLIEEHHETTHNSNHYIMHYNKHYKDNKTKMTSPVFPNTIGQSLERDDRQGAPIYEGDIRKITLRGGGWWGAVDVDKIGVVEWNDDTSMFVIRWGYSKNQHHCDDSEDIFYTSVLLGNIHDNPELIK